MTINLTLNAPLALESVQRLLASASDRTYTQIRVTKAGIVFIATDKDPAPSPDDLSFCVEGFTAGAGYVGPNAASDQDWVDRIYKVLKENWPDPTSFDIQLF